MAKEIISVGAKLVLIKEDQEIELKGLRSIPELSAGGGEAEKIEVTDLSDATKRYINGLKDSQGGGDGLTFSFNYVSEAGSSFYTLKEIEDAKETAKFKIVLPDGLSFAFDAEVQVKLSAIEVGSQITFDAVLTINSEMVITVPTFA